MNILYQYKKSLFIILGGAVMVAGDYLVSFYETAGIFFLGEIVGLLGWSIFIITLDNR